MRAILALSMLALLAGCATTTQSQWQTDVAAIQAAVPIAEVAIADSGLSTTPAIAKAELTLNSDVAALTGTVAPTSAAYLLDGVEALIVALPANTLSPAHQAEVSAALALAKLLAASAPSTALATIKPAA